MPKQIAFNAPQAAPMGAPLVDSQRYVRQQAMADALMGQGTQAPNNWGDAIGKLAQQAAGVFAGNRAKEGEMAANQARADAMRAALSSDNPIAALGQSNDPDLVSLSLQHQMAKLLKDPAETYNTLTDAEETALGLDPAGTYQRSSTGKVDVLSKAPDPFKPNVEEFYENGQRVKGYLDKDGNLVKVGDAAPMFAPQQAPTEPERVRRALAAGLVKGTPEFNEFVLGSDTPDPTKPENILRDEFNTLTKDFRAVQDAYSKIEATSNTGAGDMSMLYSYVKLLDPGSVVRESEFATAAASGSFGEQVQGAVSRLMTGERLPDSLRAAFKNEAKSIFKAQQSGYERLKKSYTSIAERSGADPANVIVDYTAPAPVDLGTTPQQTPIPGAQGAPIDYSKMSDEELLKTLGVTQ